jgi:hypothetical protein
MKNRENENEKTSEGFLVPEKRDLQGQSIFVVIRYC